MSTRKSKFVSLSQLASKATGGAYGSQAQQAPSLPPSSSALGTPNPHSGSTPHTPRTPRGPNGNANGSNSSAMDKKRATWADRVREKMPPLEDNEYEVLWERGVLGVIFLESEKDGIPYVSKATESCISPMVSPGDILKFVNVVRSKDHSFSDFFKILATMKKPVLLRFERPTKSRPVSPDDTGSAGNGEPLDQRSTSTNDISGPRATMKEAARALAARVNRSNSVPQNEKPPQKPVTRGTFWRASSAKEPPQPAIVAPPLTPAVTTPSRRDLKSPIVNLNYDDLSDTTDTSSPQWDESSDISQFSNDADDLQLVEVFWETGSLGLLFGEERGTGYPVVTRSTPDVNPHVYRLVRVNDVLLSANGIRSADYKFDAFFVRLQQMRKPVKLIFRRKISPAGTPPPRSRNTSASAEDPSEPLTVPASQPKPASHNGATPAVAVPLSRPTKLPPTANAADGEFEGLVPAQNVAEQPQSKPLRQDPSPSTKSRSPSVETHALMEEERSPANGALRGKSPSRPDIVYLGSPKKKGRLPPPSPPARLTVDVNSSPSDRGSVLRRTPSPQATSLQTSSPSERLARPEIPKPRQDKRSAVVNDLGSEVSTSAIASELVDEAEEMGVDDDIEQGVEAVGQVIDDGIAIGVPVESSDRLGEEGAVEAAEVAEAVMATAVEEFVSRSSTKSSAPVPTPQRSVPVDEGLPVSDKSARGMNEQLENDDDSDDSSSHTSSESESDEGEPLDSISIEQDDPDISGDLDNNEMLASDPKSRGSISSPSKPNKAAMNASLAKYRKKAKNSRPLVKLPAITEDASQTVPLAAPNAVNTNVQVRGRSKPKPSLVETPDSSTYLVKWKEGRSVGLQLREVRVAKGTFPLVVDVCKEPCCDVLKHVCIGDMIVEINGRNCSTMGVKKTVNFLKTSSKTMLLKLRRGPAFTNERVSAYA